MPDIHGLAVQHRLTIAKLNRFWIHVYNQYQAALEELDTKANGQ